MAFWSEGLPSGIDKDTALMLLVINVLMPGVGTVISAALATEFQLVTVLMGVAQFVTSFILVGFVWAIAWSIMLVKSSSAGSEYTSMPDAPRQAPAAAEPAAAAAAAAAAAQ